jgi:NADPH:quinone reductase-like Zn-dependent oxidoreductase
VKAHAAETVLVRFNSSGIILEMLANVNLSHDTKLLANNGRVIVIGSRGEVTINPRELMGRRASIRAFTLWGITAEEEAEIHAALFAGLESGTLRPIVGKELSLAEAARATRKSSSPDRLVRSCSSHRRPSSRADVVADWKTTPGAVGIRI